MEPDRRIQDGVIEWIGRKTDKLPAHLHPGRTYVNTPYRDGSVEVTIGTGACWLVGLDGHLTIRPFNHSVDWNQ